MRLLTLTLLPALLAIAAAGNLSGICPEPEDIAPCSCQRDPYRAKSMLVTCVGGALDDIKEAFEHLRGKAVYKMVLNNITADRLPSNLFSGLRAVNLRIEECDLKGVADTDDAPAFEGIQNLKFLTIYRSIKGDNKMTALNLAHLKELESLDLSGNNIPELGNDWFAQAPKSLEDVYIKQCGTRILGDRAFQPLANLWGLSMENNPFRTFHRSMLPRPATKLKVLVLENASLDSLPEDMFSEMPFLQFVNFGFNPMGRLPEATWSSIWTQLDAVYLNGNPLVCDWHIEWTFKLKLPATIRGSCVYPDDRKDKSLFDLIRLNRNLAFQRKKM